MTTGLRESFKSPYSEYKYRNGESFEVIRTIDEPDDNHDAESLPMYVVRFADGSEIEAWPEEIFRPGTGLYR